MTVVRDVAAFLAEADGGSVGPARDTLHANGPTQLTHGLKASAFNK